MSFLASLSPEAVAEIEQLVERIVEQRLAERTAEPELPVEDGETRKEIAAARRVREIVDLGLPLMTVDEAAVYLRARPQRVRDLLYQRRLRPKKDGTRTLIRDDLDAYLDSR